MLASLLCIQHRQISGNPIPSISNMCFDYRDDGLLSDCKDDELFFECRDDVQSKVMLGVRECKKEARMLVKDKEKVKSYISVIAAAERVPEEIQRLKDVAIDGSLVDKLENQRYDTDVALLFTVQCYLYYCKWKQQNDDDAVLLLLLS